MEEFISENLALYLAETGKIPPGNMQFVASKYKSDAGKSKFHGRKPVKTTGEV
ncbi:unknown [Bacteroides sp. CAG:462]|jgi:hypothetical protein|nr:unknown [Bacteroides sp. CAG:462]